MTKKIKNKIKTYAEYKILRYEVKVKTKQTTKIITSIYKKKTKRSQIYQKCGKLFVLLSMWAKNVNIFHAASLPFPISSLVNLAFVTGEFPKLCKIAKATPLFTKK